LLRFASHKLRDAIEPVDGPAVEQARRRCASRRPPTQAKGSTMALLSGFEIARRGGDYLIHFNTEDGETIELVASFEQLDLIAEEIDRQLDNDEATALAVGEDDADAS
jgi:hypothetical protein